MSAPVAVVTGASRGIGKQLCIDLASQGYDVVCAARSTSGQPSKLPGTVDETAKEVEARGRRAFPVGLDVRDEPAVHALADRVYTELGRCDVLVNNAAVAVPGPALPDASKRWRLAVDVNLSGPFYLMQAFCPRMTRGAGRVVNISSMAVSFPEFGRPSYSATKAALESLTQSLGHELRERVAVNCIRLDVPVWSEGFSFTLDGDAQFAFEHPVIMSDALLWLLKQPIDFTGQILTLTGLREQGVVRPVTPMQSA
jgi:NAD(P)-dependent dehydrogenase (short-subunit alcohol dehydrogenase family)